MSLQDKMANLMGSVRAVSGTSEKLGIDDASKVLDNTSVFTDHGIVSAGSANDLTEAGMYSIQNNVTDGPTDPWGMLTVFTSKKANNHYVRQDFSASSGGVFSRLGIKANNQGLKWGPWNKIGGGRNPLLSAVKGLLTPRKGGVAYVA